MIATTFDTLAYAKRLRFVLDRLFAELAMLEFVPRPAHSVRIKVELSTANGLRKVSQVMVD